MSRRAALRIVASVVPSDWGDARFARITGGNYAPGFGTTCGYLTSYLLYELGCRDGRIVNRTDERWKMRYGAGENISRLVGGAKELGAWREGPVGIRPGDCYLISNGPPETEHVGVFVAASRGVWRTADAGQRNERGDQASRYVWRAFDGKRVSTQAVDGQRTVQGYVDIDRLPYAARIGVHPAAIAAAAAVVYGFLAR